MKKFDPNKIDRYGKLGLIGFMEFLSIIVFILLAIQFPFLVGGLVFLAILIHIWGWLLDSILNE
jgi:hypothetical protein